MPLSINSLMMGSTVGGESCQLCPILSLHEEKMIPSHKDTEHRA